MYPGLFVINLSTQICLPVIQTIMTQYSFWVLNLGRFILHYHIKSSRTEPSIKYWIVYNTSARGCLLFFKAISAQYGRDWQQTALASVAFRQSRNYWREDSVTALTSSLHLLYPQMQNTISNFRVGNSTFRDTSEDKLYSWVYPFIAWVMWRVKQPNSVWRNPWSNCCDDLKNHQNLRSNGLLQKKCWNGWPSLVHPGWLSCGT